MQQRSFDPVDYDKQTDNRQRINPPFRFRPKIVKEIGIEIKKEAMKDITHNNEIDFQETNLCKNYRR